MPSAIRAILTEPSTQNDNKHPPVYLGRSYIHVDANCGKHIKNQSPQDLYFPMPYNDKQVKIVQMLECYDGVVVQGPPGTGNTHTIANIISHYFAIGKRILVTSMEAPALAVLRNKLPEEIRQLAISLITNEQEGINQLDQQVHEFHANLANVSRQIRSWAKKNLEKIIIDGVEYSPAEIAQEVVDSSGKYEWLEDNIALENIPLFDETDIAKLREARQAVGNDIKHLEIVLPKVSDLPDKTKLIVIHHDIQKHSKLQDKVTLGALPPLINFNQDTLDKLLLLNKEIDILIELDQKVESSQEHWISNAQALLIQKLQI